MNGPLCFCDLCQPSTDPDDYIIERLMQHAAAADVDDREPEDPDAGADLT